MYRFALLHIGLLGKMFSEGFAIAFLRYPLYLVSPIASTRHHVEVFSRTSWRWFLSPSVTSIQ